MSDVVSQSVDSVAAAVHDGELDPHAYVDACCDRISERESDVKALLQECDRRERLQRAVDEAFETGPADEQSLGGIPVGIKDIIHVDGMTTEAGTALPPELYQGPEAEIVSRLREEGAVVIKTRTTEFAGSGPALTRNPNDLAHTPGGSSSGSAAAVAAGMVPLAVGTQTGGSVIRPASYCGIVGFKPSFERIPTDGVITRSQTLDHLGLYTRQLSGMELSASVVCDSWTPVDRGDKPVIGIPEGPYLEQASPESFAVLESQIDSLEQAGFTIEPVEMFADYERIDEHHHNLSLGELALNFDEWIDQYRLFFRIKMIERIERGKQVTTEELATARRVPEALSDRITNVMDERGIDLWICPAAPGPAPEGISTTGDSKMNRLWTTAGVPAATIPAGEINGLPVGLQCVGKYGEDEKLIADIEPIYRTLVSDG